MQTVLKITRDSSLAPQPNEVRLLRIQELPPRELITSALGLFFVGDALLMSNLVSRGWDIPGGHIEAGESPEATVRREVREETGAELGDIWLFAAQRIEILASRPPGYRYPYPVSYQVFYCGEVARLHPYTANGEVHERGLFDPVQVRGLAWVQGHPEMYAAARDRAGIAGD